MGELKPIFNRKSKMIIAANSAKTAFAQFLAMSWASVLEYMVQHENNLNFFNRNVTKLTILTLFVGWAPKTYIFKAAIMA